MRNMYNPRYDDDGFTVSELKEEFDALEHNGVHCKDILYSYGLLGFLHTFKNTDKGISCYDTLGNYVYFHQTSKYIFYKLNFFHE